MPKKNKKDPIGNNEKVLAFGASGSTYPYTLGKLKNAFMTKKLPETIKSIQCVRTSQHYFVHLNPTKGFTFEKLKVPK